MSLFSLSKREKYFFLTFFIAIFLIYGQSLWGGFVFDDRGILEHRDLLSSLSNIVQVTAFPYWNIEAGLYRPTTLLSYMFNIVFLGGSATSFHLVNLILYFAICVSIYFLIRRLFKDEWLGFITAFTFLVLPIHTEVVANITGHSELLALFFSLLVLLEFTREKVNWWRPGLWLLLGMGAKETAFAAIPLAGLIIFLREGGVNFSIAKRYWRAILGTVLGSAIYFLMRYFVLGPNYFMGVETSIIENPLLFADASSRIATALGILGMYVSKTLWPVNLCSDYSYNQIPITADFLKSSIILGSVVLLTALTSFLFFLKRQPIISFATAIFLASFIPVSNILFPIGTIAGERLFFFPSLGFAMLVGFLFLVPIKKLRNKRMVVVMLGMILIVLSIYGYLSFKRQADWLSEERLFLSALECAPNSVLSLSNAGTVYYFRGDYDKAEELLEESKSINPVYSKGLNNLGLVYWKQGRFREAEQMYLESLRQKYPYYGAIENLILLYLDERDYDKATRWLRVLYPNSEEEIGRFIEEHQRQ